MKLIITDRTIIYLPLVPNVSTGGPEAIHRLAFYLRNKLGLNVEIYYSPKTENTPVHDEYLKYENPYTFEIIDSEENIIIFPEFVKHLLLQYSYTKIQKCLWWLSIDFFYMGLYENYFGYKRFKFLNNKIKILNILNYYLPQIFVHTDLAKESIKQFNNIGINELELIKNIKVHFCQSKYSHQWLNKFNIFNKYFLTDFFDVEILNSTYDIAKKENIVVYNPSKGFSFTRHILKKNQKFKFVPIKDLNKKDVINLLKKAKIYIDFGNHPGRDRLPREAALCGCCVITNKRGSANFNEDVPIPEKYKLIDEYGNVTKILKLTTDIMNNFEYHHNNFNTYRNFCKEINNVAESQIDSIFSKQ